VRAWYKWSIPEEGGGAGPGWEGKTGEERRGVHCISECGLDVIVEG
jgi:hypothetical protein